MKRAEPNHGDDTGNLNHGQLGNSRGQNVSFLDSEDCIWHENPSEEVITYVGNGTFCAVLEYNR